MCINYWNADACRQCGTVSNLVAPGKADPRTGLENTRGSMCYVAQMRENRHTQHRDRPLQAANLARFRKRTLCGDYEPALRGDKRTAGIKDLTYLWRICSPACKRKRAAHVPQWSSPLKRRVLEIDADYSGGDEVAEKKSPGESYSKLSSTAGRLKKTAPLRDEILSRNFRSDLERRGILLVDDDAPADEDNVSGDDNVSQDDDKPPRKRICAQLPSLEEEDDGTF